MSPPRGGRYGWAVPLLLVLAVFIVATLAFNLANLPPFRESGPSVAQPSPGRSDVGLFNPNLIATVVIWILGGLSLGWILVQVLRRKRRSFQPPPFSWWNVVATVLGFVLLLPLLFLARKPLPAPANETSTGNGTGGTTVLPPSLAPPGWPMEAFLLLAVFVALAWTVYRVRLQAAPAVGSVDLAPPPEDRQEAGRAVDEALHELEIGTDVRTAILACYQRFCRVLGSRGITDQRALTPRELEELARARLAVSREASETLTSLFEEARYSEHPLGDGARDRAIESLGQIRAALGA